MQKLLRFGYVRVKKNSPRKNAERIQEDMVFEKNKKDEGPDMVASLIDANMRITGSVESSGDIVLAGKVEGDVICKSLVVKDEAVISGSVKTEEVVIAGQVSGDVTSDRVQLTSTAKFDGTLRCSGIEVEAGAHVTAKFNKSKKSKVKT